MTRQISYADAVRILGEVDSPLLRTIDQILGGAIVVAAVVTGRLEILSLLEARDEMLKRTKALLSRIGKRVRGSRGKARIDLLIAAHAVIAVNSYFEALRHDSLPINLARLELTTSDQFRLAGTSPKANATSLIEFALSAPMPAPAAHRPYEQTVLALQQTYLAMSERLIKFISGLVIWDQTSASDKSKFRQALLDRTPRRAIEAYEESFRKLSEECPEFRHWIHLTDSIATREAIDMGFAQLQREMQDLAGGHAATKWPERLARKYRCAMKEPLVDASPDEHNLGLRIPLLSEGYVPPSFKITEYDADARPAHKSWWDDIPTCSDMAGFIVGHLTSPVATETPLVVLGDPGSGKSLFTTILAASLPPEDYLPVRVELRHVDADKRVRDQIEQAMNDATNERMEWSKLAEEAGDALPVVLLDGYDELLQATKLSHSDYLQEVRDFQRTEASQGRRVAFVVTSRMIAADRIRFPLGTVLVKLEPFSNMEIIRWLDAWNASNSDYFYRHELEPLTLDTVLAQEDLARQPLLLLMLALYDTDSNSLPNGIHALVRADLYEKILVKFIGREVDKRWPGIDERARREQIVKELSELSVLGLGIFNRGLKALSEVDLESDLRAFGFTEDKLDGTAGRLDHRLSEGELAVGRFFFVVHNSQVILRGMHLREYEFLHATFGEYLVARMLLLALERFADEDSSLKDCGNAMTTSSSPDDYLWTLLSFAPLADGSQTIVFIAERMEQLGENRRAKLESCISGLFLSAHQPRSAGYGGYRPTVRDVVARHSIFSANLLMLSLIAADRPIFASRILGNRDDVIERWRSFALLWRSQLGVGGWENLVRMVNVVRETHEDGLDIEICLATEDSRNLSREFGRLDWPSARELDEATRDDVFLGRQGSFMCLLEEDLLIHGSLPLLRNDPQILSDVVTQPDNTRRSVMHEALRRSHRHVIEKVAVVRAEEELRQQQNSPGGGPQSGA